MQHWSVQLEGWNALGSTVCTKLEAIKSSTVWMNVQHVALRCCQVLQADSDSACFDFLFRRPDEHWFRSCCTAHQCFLVDACLPAMLQFARRHASNTSAIFSISKALARLMTILNDEGILLSESDEDKLFDFVCSFWDFTAEAVCHECLAYHKILSSVAENFSVEFCKRMYSLLPNPTLVVVLRLLPTIAKNPLLLDWTVNEFRKYLKVDVSDKASIEAVLFIAKFCVFHQKANGSFLDWTHFIDEQIVVVALLSADLQIRLMAWKLMCDHPKVTSPIPADHLTLCKCFLVSNMAEQSPSARSEILAGLKKISELIAFDLSKNFADSDRCRLHVALLLESFQSSVKDVRSAVQLRLLPTIAKNPLLLDWIVNKFRKYLEDSLDGLETDLRPSKSDIADSCWSLNVVQMFHGEQYG
ncbi:unnamed protein product [Gongylonema pulchrum]|uniref:DUF2428 domain-containing protein n=1 Tax=Gongylonema pulchrum TaxID=637853 RepID=A0A183DN37_9BILA|nr:unnamed protein product [Gongylonema pulchrum]